MLEIIVPSIVDFSHSVQYIGVIFIEIIYVYITMGILDIILIIIIVVILIVIVYNFFAYGRDLSIYPKSGVRRVSDDEYYPGSPLYDEFTDDEYSEGNGDDEGYYDTDVDNKGLPKRRYPKHPKHPKHNPKLN